MLNKFIVAFMLMFVMVGNVGAEQIGKVETSGLLMKDSIEIHVFNDPDYPSISCYFTKPKRSLSFTDQTNSSISCRLVGKVPEGRFTSRKHIVSASKGLFVKSMQIDRSYDSKRNVMVYISYTKKLSGDNASHSLSVVPLSN